MSKKKGKPLTVTWITDHVAIGNYLAAQDSELLKREGITSVISLDGTLRGREPQDLGLKTIEVFMFEDGPGNDIRVFRLAIDTLRRCVTETPPVLVHCRAGRSRSVVVVAGYLMQTFGLDADEAMARIRGNREINVAIGLERLLDWL